MEQELSKAQSQQSAPGLAGQPAAVAEALAREQRERRYITASGIDIRESALSLAEEYERPEGILVQESSDAPLMTREGLSLVLGPPKCRKTSLCVGIVTALLGHPLLGLYSPDEEKAARRVVLMFDTEQGRGYAQMTYRKVHKLMGWDTHRNNSRLVYIDLRPFTREQRVEMVRTAIEAYRPQVVFIDGIVDLCGDYNDQKECSTLMNLLLELAGSHGMHICSCLHTNKDGRTERGTLGAMYKQKAETTFYVKGYQEYSEVKPADGGCRQKPFTP
ncbi:MAG: AAA family ATPase, partial [Prevotellaceae bacterium]|nr:AAA family ATPase [Prevotellaceae bacterium]